MQYAILEQLRSPPPEYKDVILDHFRCAARSMALARVACDSCFLLGAVAGVLPVSGPSRDIANCTTWT